MNTARTTTPSKSPPTATALSLESVRARLRRANLYGLLAQAEQILHELTADFERHYAGQLLRRQQTIRQSRPPDLSDGRADTHASR
jgi:hypothetical protein